ncbi:hypothetical protein SAMN04490201_0517 [Pseudomonas psychrophila]|uniref:Uncharacterized protein n=1 Tax=Pseudomonas psychrophila TaxID=122355 RepID=A0ABY0VFH0_9PSED|nr:hypothetical protein SAMN04490201_0517 [Pseudomonas psychrophila]
MSAVRDDSGVRNRNSTPSLLLSTPILHPLCIEAATQAALTLAIVGHSP